MVIRDGDPPGFTPSSTSHYSHYCHDDTDDTELRRAAAAAQHQTNTAVQRWHNRIANHPRINPSYPSSDPSDPFGESTMAGLPSANPSASYWLQKSEESQRLEDFRSTRELPGTADTVIVGSSASAASSSSSSSSSSSTAGQPSGDWKQKYNKPWPSTNWPPPPDWNEEPALDPFSPHTEEEEEEEENENSYTGVLMLEARQPCSGATGRNGGHCQPLIYSSSSSTAEFELATYHFIKSFVEKHEIGEQVDWRTLKTVHGYLTDEVWEGAKGLVEKLPEGLRGQVELVDHDERKTTEDGETLRHLRVPGVKGAVVQRHAASLWPYKLVAWVLRKLLEKYPVQENDRLAGLHMGGKGRAKGGFNLQSNTPVLGLHRLRGGKWMITTSRGEIRANRVLIATNGYTSNLLPGMKDLIIPVRSQVASLRPPKDVITKKVAELDYSYAFVSEEKFPRDEYLIQRPLPGGELIYGGARSHAENKAVGVWQDDDVERGVATYLRQNLAPYPLDLTPDKSGAVPTPNNTPTDGNETTELKATHQWTGIMGFSRDASPWVGQVPEMLGGGENLYVCAGYTGHGMPQAALAARMVAEEILGKPVRDDGLELPKEMKLTEERVRYVRENTKTLQEQQKAPGWSATMPELLAVTERRG
ncbi:hypothetical protein SMACR_07513 [Sordaria macrospora]|uniref:WGS project CABT00000000 data, contig 2.7 n=2 Tax=Sordaria macrospora TaxID=5147 RepID=F7VTN8_SORMK|nr:uncharacterized protein SMAC_07513 [Sordaria macrospora k-hell]KAA8634493.1 hypothetical protein SMACR_07513 [Sordaria macrospora]WPJ60878.1 hypothetical protein SMAC4_07513 [Sordaria macrospora]CCC08876.1 unnamed protein product [Sordaria macrospora k-hell]